MIQNDLLIFKIIYRYSKLFIDIQNYLPIFKIIYRYSNFRFYQDFLANAEKLPQPPIMQNGKLKDEETVLIYWSSGTTGDPKGIQYSLENFRANLGQMRAQVNLF